MADPIEVALCFDDYLALPGAVAILSVLEAHRGNVRLHVLTDPQPKAAPLLEAIAREFRADLRIVSTAPERREGLDPTSPYGRPSTATYRRIFLGELLPDLQRVLYLDADLLVRQDLAQLWATPLGDALLAAAADPWMATFPEQSGDYPGGYFNAGMLLIDLARWRSEDLTARCIAELERQRVEAARTGRDALSCGNDQTALNAVLRGRWRAVSPRWNFTTLHVPRVGEALGMAPQDYSAAAADPAIVHFLGAYKPWLPGCEALTAWHAAYHRRRQAMEKAFATGPLAWPGPYSQGEEAVRRRRLIALRLVHEAKTRGFTRPVIVVSGLLGRDLLIVAREQGLDPPGFASEVPALAGGRLDGVRISSIRQAIADGHRDFVLGDYRRVGWTRSAIDNEAARQSADVRIVAWQECP